MNIKENSKILKLSYIFNNYENEIKEARQTKKDPERFFRGKCWWKILSFGKSSW